MVGRCVFIVKFVDIISASTVLVLNIYQNNYEKDNIPYVFNNHISNKYIWKY